MRNKAEAAHHTELRAIHLLAALLEDETGLANSILEAHIVDEEENRNIEAMLASRRSELERLSRKIDNYIEMRADGDLSRETFRTKCAELEPRMQQLQKEIEELSAEAQPKEVVDYKEKLEVLQYALEQYTHRNEDEDVPESVIEAFVVKIVVSKDSFDWYLRFDGDPDKPLHCKCVRRFTKSSRPAKLSIDSARIEQWDRPD